MDDEQPLYLITDTDVLLEFPFFREVNWAELARAKNVVLGITIPVLAELDRHKNGQNDRRRNRARHVLRHVMELTRGVPGAYPVGIREGAAIQLIPYMPKPADFGPDLDRESFDDRLLIVVRHLHAQGVPVLLVTGDTALQVRARLLGIPVLPMREDLRRQPEPSAEARQIKDLKAELEALRERLAAVVGRQPQPVIMLETPTGLTAEVELTLKTPKRPIAQDLDERTAKIDQRLRALVAQLRRPPETLGLGRFLQRQPADAEIDSFERAIKPYLSKYRSFLQELYEWETGVGRTWVATFVIVNHAGTASCDDAEVTLEFPDEVREIDPPDPPDPPEAPSPPDTRGPFAQIADMMATSDRLQKDLLKMTLDSPRTGYPGKPRIRRGHSWIAEFPPIDVHAGGERKLHPILLSFPPESDTFRELVVKYRILARTLVGPTHGVIKITVTYAPVPPWSIVDEFERDEADGKDDDDR